MTNVNDPVHSFFSEDNGNIIGLTKLEAFTLEAMQGLCSNPAFVRLYDDGSGINIRNHLSPASVKIAKDTIAALNA